jgi:hypothetical protein
MLDFQAQLDQFFQGNDKGYPRDPRRMAYAKLRKNTLGMDREQLEAFIDANLMIPFSQYKMALGNLIKFVQKYDEMNKLNEVKHFQKIAGLLKEAEGVQMEQVYDNAIRYAYEMTPEFMYEDGKLENAESLIQAEEEFVDLLRAKEINPASTLAYNEFFKNAWEHAKHHGATDIEDFKIWFTDTAVSSPAYQDAFE